MFYVAQFRSLVDRVLQSWPELYSAAAIELLLGTAAQESRFGTYLRQLRNGPAIGVFQMEPATFDWLRARYGEQYGFADRSAGDMEWDLRLAILLVRLRYRIAPDPLPKAGDLDGLAGYWKQVYNTPAGAGTVEEFRRNYGKYVGAG